MRARRTAAVAAIGCWTFVLALIGLSLALRGPTFTGPASVVEAIWFWIFALIFASVAAVVAARQPSNAVGWLLFVPPVSAAADDLGDAFVNYATRVGVENVAGEELAAWLSQWITVAGMGVAVTFLLLLFPSGRLPSSRWRIVAATAGGGLLLEVAGIALAPGPLEGGLLRPNPFGLQNPALVDAVTVVGMVLLSVGIVGSVASLFVRAKSASPVERQQLKWLLLAGIAILICFPLALALGVGEWDETTFLPRFLFTAPIAFLPMAIGIAVLRYRLYDIDRIINKTLVYGAVTALLALGYAGGVLLAQAVLSVTDDSPVVVAATTLAVVALFRPLRNRVQGFVDRRFYRRRYDAARTIESFGTRLRQETDLDSLKGQLVGLVNDTMQPAHVSLWLRS